MSLGLATARGRELRLEARPLASFISLSNTQKHINPKKPKHGSKTAGLLRTRRCLFSMSQREGAFQIFDCRNMIKIPLPPKLSPATWTGACASPFATRAALGSERFWRGSRFNLFSTTKYANHAKKCPARCVHFFHGLYRRPPNAIVSSVFNLQVAKAAKKVKT